MSLIDDLRAGIGTIQATLLSGGLLADVPWRRCLAATGSGLKTLADPVVVQGLVQQKTKQVRSLSGELVTSQVQLLLLDPTIVVGAEDVFTLPDGSEPPILVLDGAVVDPGTRKPVLTQVYFG